MNFQNFAAKTAMVGAIGAGALMLSTPAQAASLTGGLTLSGNANVLDYFTGAVTKNLVFTDVDGVAGYGDFAGLTNPAGISIDTLKVTRVGTTPGPTPGSSVGVFTAVQNTPANPFVNFGTRTIGSTTAMLTFVMNNPLSPISLIGSKTTSGGLNLSFSGIFDPIDGYFQFGGQTVATGIMTAGRSGNVASNGSYTLSFTADPIPTPALLPGLVGMGVAAFRRRKSAVKA